MKDFFVLLLVICVVVIKIQYIFKEEESFDKLKILGLSNNINE